MRGHFRSGKWGTSVAEEILVKEQLAPEMRDAGNELTKRLRQRKDVELLCSLWLYASQRNRWKLMIGTPLVENQGTIHAYRLIQGIMRHLWPAEWEMPLQTISLLRSNHSLVVAIRSLGHFEIPDLPQGPGPVGTLSVPKRIDSTRVQGVFIEDAYVYFIQ